jgi:hypothetical protein
MLFNHLNNLDANVSASITINTRKVEISSLMRNFINDYKSSASSTTGMKSVNLRLNQGLLSSGSILSSEQSLSSSLTQRSAIIRCK